MLLEISGHRVLIGFIRFKVTRLETAFTGSFGLKETIGETVHGFGGRGNGRLFPQLLFSYGSPAGGSFSPRRSAGELFGLSL